MPNRANSRRFSNLREKAEQLRDAKHKGTRQAEYEDVSKLIQELELHQIELELSNEELERVRDELTETRDKYFGLYDLAPVGYMTLSIDGKIKEANLAAANMLGHSRQDLVGRLLTSLIDPDYLLLFNNNWQQAMQSREARSFELKPLDDRDKWIQITLDTELSEQSETDFVRLIFIDQTERRRAEERIRSLNRLLHRHATQLRAANEELKAFSYSVSHDLKAPLRAIRGFSEFLLEEHGMQMDYQARDYVNRIQDAGGQMQRLIDSLLQLSRVGRSEMRRTPLDLSSLAGQIAAELKQANPNSAAEFVVSDTEPVKADEGLTRVVLQNLLANAVKFSAGQKPPRIEFGETSTDSERVFFVIDNGVGFDEEHADRLFQPFGRLHTADEFAGDGIGLAMVRRAVNRQGGRVWAEGQPGKGARFYFTLSHPEGDKEAQS
jgi:PAS domain S-box-containing protein